MKLAFAILFGIVAVISGIVWILSLLPPIILGWLLVIAFIIVLLLPPILVILNNERLI